ncbi:protein kinase [Lentinula boryana]|uniref:Protein kinase n=1 Tax=Lentinula boryana TaxID=40481 RepID=A0ABQ8Q0W3_9AGAR|nr:protein kinase [Lentinula boryana]
MYLAMFNETQKQRTYGPPVVESTPQGNKYGTHAKDEVPQRASVLNKFLEDDVDDRVVLTLNDFATVILDLPTNWEVKENFDLPPESKAVKDAFEAYLKVAEGVPTGKEGKHDGLDEKMFYVQDPRPVLGSLLERKPDLGGIYTQLLELAENKIAGVFWGLLLFFSASRAQSRVLSSIDKLLTSHAPAPDSAMSSDKRDTAQVTIHQSGGREKILEVGTEQYYERKAEEELEEETKLTPTQGQRHTREMLSNGFIRSHAIGITADSGVFRFQYYDRSKVVESEAFHIVDEEWRKLFMAMVCQLNQLSSEKLGFIPNLHLDDFDYLRDPKQFAQDFKDNPEGLVGVKYRFKCSDGCRRIFVIKRVLYRAEGIIGRGSIVVEVECICTESGCKWHGERKIMKISFPSRRRPLEDALIQEARLKAESTGAHWALNHLPQIVDSITLTYDESTVQGRLKSHLKEKYEERVTRVVILEKLHPLSELEDPRDFAQVFYDILQIHQWLYECAGILHRDLSIGNIMFRRKDDKIYGVLNDFDLSSRVQDMDQGPSSNHRSGTRPFMSPELLNPDWKGGHYYRHDLESLFYIMVCVACRYERPGVAAAEPRAYSKWFHGTDEEVRDNKTSFLCCSPPANMPIQPYFAGFKLWLKPIYHSAKYSSGPRESESDDENFHFDWITMNKCVCYATIRSTMFSFEGNHLETRWAGWNPDH